MWWFSSCNSSFGLILAVLLTLVSVSSDVVFGSIISGLPPGFIAEVVANTAAITGVFAPNPRNNGKPMLILISKTGKIKVLEDPDNSDKSMDILSLRSDELCSNGERGIQSLALHPDFEQNNLVYVFYNKFRAGCEQQTGNEPWNVVIQVPMNPNTLQLNMDAKKEIWRASRSHKGVHNGGAMFFGNDGYLYITTGDGGKSSNSQPLTNTHGSIIRLNEDGSVPDSNPFTAQNGYKAVRCADTNGEAPEGSVCSEVYAHGLRNPFRIAIDPTETTRTLFTISDVGGSYWEEMNYAGTDYAGKNYGYPILEGVCEHGSARRCPLPGERDFEDPFHWYAHRSTENGGCVSGATYVPKGVFPSKYKFLFADFVFNQVYKLIDDGEECRTCSPPTSRFRNETFFRSSQGPEDASDDGARMTDMFFGPYKDTQALYVVFRGNSQTVLRFRWNAIKDNGIPIPIITVDDRPFEISESIQFDGSFSEDPDGDALEYSWSFGDGSTSRQEKPTHSYSQKGQYEVRLIVTDAFEQEQEVTHTVVVGSPPTATIASPEEDLEFVVGQVFTLQGRAFDADGNRLDDTQLSWEVRQHHADHWHPFLDPTSGNNIEISPAPPPEDFFASTNSYLKVILTATDVNGVSTVVERNIQPTKVLVDIETSPQGLTMMVDYYPVETSDQIVSWIDHDLVVSVDDQPPYLFTSWSDGVLDKDRKVKVEEDGQIIQANFCAADDTECDGNDECCSGRCSNGVCVEGGPTAQPTSAPYPMPTYVTSSPTISPTSPPTATASESPTSNPTGEPPKGTILSPLEGETFTVGQILTLMGFGVSRGGGIVQLSWSMHVVSTTVDTDVEVAKQSGSEGDMNVIRTIMTGRPGSAVESPACPNPESLSHVLNSHIEIWLDVSDPTDGATSTFTRVLDPVIASLDVKTNPVGLQIIANETTFVSGSTIQTWDNDDLRLSAVDQGNYRFIRWEDNDFDTEASNVEGNDRIVRVLASRNNSVTASFCGIWDASCAGDSDCCSDFFCDTSTDVCESKDGSPRPPSLNTPGDGVTFAEASVEGGSDIGGLGIGAFVAIIVGGLIVVGVCVWFVVRQRRLHQTNKILKNAIENSDEVEALGAVGLDTAKVNGGNGGGAITPPSGEFDGENPPHPSGSADDTFEMDLDSSKDDSKSTNSTPTDDADADADAEETGQQP
mmetsp:Transcript_44369/g.107295  ORF Transcript_44369/g.107295 Transcript_44369/m.107295 type:complete len:1184 (-) Transcript_44369:345-3896(-)